MSRLPQAKQMFVPEMIEGVEPGEPLILSPQNRMGKAMNVHDDQVLIEKLKSLPPQRRAEVEDFVDFLRSRDEEQRLSQTAAQVSEPAFKAIWDNPDDAEYDQL